MSLLASMKTVELSRHERTSSGVGGRLVAQAFRFRRRGCFGKDSHDGLRVASADEQPLVGPVESQTVQAILLGIRKMVFQEVK